MVAGARLYVDRRESALNEAGEILIPKAEGVIDDVLLGTVSGRTLSNEVTLFESLGIGVEDLAAAHHVYAAAKARGVGAWVEVGGRHFGPSGVEG